MSIVVLAGFDMGLDFYLNLRICTFSENRFFICWGKVELIIFSVIYLGSVFSG